MTAPLTEAVPRPGSRAERMSHPRAIDTLKFVAERHGVCVRPIVLRRTDRETGQTDIIEVPCGATLAAKCKPCAERGRRRRIQQIREGWHLDTEPTVPVKPASDDVLELVRLRAHLEFERSEAERAARFDQIPDLDAGIAEVDEAIAATGLRGHLTPESRTPKPRKTRSTRRRNDTPGLPRLPVDDRTVGRAYTGRAGRTHRPSMLLTLTLGSYGPVHTCQRRGATFAVCGCGVLHGQRDDILGTAVDPQTYDYRRAALDAIHFARVMDRFLQNLRRAVGWKVQYAGAVELQKRLAPHAHYTVRGAIPRKLLRQVAAATYHQVWWPPFDVQLHTVDRPPVWDPDVAGYVDPKTCQPLPTWTQATTAIADDGEPAYVARLGSIDPREMRGVEAGTPDAERAIRYVTKYVTKNLADTAAPRGEQAQAHFSRLHSELAVLPCSPSCANWLLYGVQPDHAKAGLVLGRCTGKVHQADTLGFTGRRVLISRKWSGKTLTDHRHDNHAWVKAILAGHLADGNDDQGDEPNQSRRYSFEHARPDDPDVPPLQHRLLRTIHQHATWKEALAKARDRTTNAVSATQDHRDIGRAA
jgi:hypothetical protein